MPAFKHEHALARAREIRRVDQAVMATADQDRKSTRLNSSHSQISYAVFCLKKKKNSHSDSALGLRVPIPDPGPPLLRPPASPAPPGPATAAQLRSPGTTATARTTTTTPYSP